MELAAIAVVAVAGERDDNGLHGNLSSTRAVGEELLPLVSFGKLEGSQGLCEDAEDDAHIAAEANARHLLPLALRREPIL